MRISIIGAGYVGLVTAVALATKGHNIIVIDVDNIKVDAINRGESPIWEEGLDELLLNCVRDDGSLKASSDYGEILDSDVTLICVDTISKSDGSLNLSNIEDSVKGIGTVLSKKRDYHVVVTRSTVIPGTTRNLIVPLLGKYSGKQVGSELGVAVNPEFMQEGKALQTSSHPDRIIIGEYDRKAGDMVRGIYDDISVPILRTDITTAEMIKSASNAFLTTKISFINEIGNICQKLGIDVYTVAKGMGFDHRIGDQFLNAGVGFGGSCLPKDLKALLFTSVNDLSYRPRLLEAVYDVNRDQAMRMIELAEQKLGNLANKRISILGLAFKPNTADIRVAPAIEIIRRLLEKGALIAAYDPEAMLDARRILPQARYCDSAIEAVSDSDCVLVLTEWNEFRDESLYHGKVVIDGRRILIPERAKAFCDYQGICW